MLRVQLLPWFFHSPITNWRANLVCQFICLCDLPLIACHSYLAERQKTRNKSGDIYKRRNPLLQWVSNRVSSMAEEEESSTSKRMSDSPFKKDNIALLNLFINLLRIYSDIRLKTPFAIVQITVPFAMH